MKCDLCAIEQILLSFVYVFPETWSISIMNSPVVTNLHFKSFMGYHGIIFVQVFGKIWAKYRAIEKLLQKFVISLRSELNMGRNDTYIIKYIVL